MPYTNTRWSGFLNRFSYIFENSRGSRGFTRDFRQMTSRDRMRRTSRVGGISDLLHAAITSRSSCESTQRSPITIAETEFLYYSGTVPPWNVEVKGDYEGPVFFTESLEPALGGWPRFARVAIRDSQRERKNEELDSTYIIIMTREVSVDVGRLTLDVGAVDRRDYLELFDIDGLNFSFGVIRN